MDKIEFFPIDAGSRGSATPGAARTRAGAAREAEREAGKAAGIAKGGGDGSDGSGSDGEGRVVHCLSSHQQAFPAS